MITPADAPVQVADQFEATIVWMSDEAMTPGRAYWIKIGTQSVSASIQAPKYQVNVNTLEHMAGKTLELNAIGVATLTTDRPIPFEPYEQNRALGGFIVIDKMTNATVGAGMLRFSLRRSQNVHWQALDVSREVHAGLKNQKPAVLWFTGFLARARAPSPIWSRRSWCG